MVRVRESWKKGLPVGVGVLVGAMLATLPAGGAARATAAGSQLQDPAVQMQIQQALSNFQIQLQNDLNLMRSTISTLEREQQRLRFQLDTGTAGRTGSASPIPADPIPGVATYGRLVSEASESELFVLKATRGDLLGQLGMTSDGPGLILFDASGQVSVALLATPQGAELRMVDGDGTLQTVLSGR